MKVPERYCVITADMLKGIALVAMVVDHTAVCVIKGYVRIHGAAFSQEQFRIVEMIYRIMCHVGRTAFPLFAFLLVEGFFRTRSRRNYIGRILAAALLSEVPFDLMLFGRSIAWERQNTLFTLAIGLMILQTLSYLRRYCRYAQWMIDFLGVAVCASGAMLSCVCKTDYSYKGIALILVFYLFYDTRISAAVAGFFTFCWEPWSFPAFLLIPFYNGKRNGRFKYLVYLFYPSHLLLLYLVSRIVC